MKKFRPGNSTQAGTDDRDGRSHTDRHRIQRRRRKKMRGFFNKRNEYRYRKSWEGIPELRGWLVSVPSNPHQGKCVYCSQTLIATLGALLSHSRSERHLRRVAESSNCRVEIGETSINATGLDEAMDNASDSNGINSGSQNSGDCRFRTYPARTDCCQHLARYEPEWERLPEFRDWIVPIPDDPRRAGCRFCEIALRAVRRTLTVHSQSARHIRRAAAINNDQSENGDSSENRAGLGTSAANYIQSETDETNIDETSSASAAIGAYESFTVEPDQVDQNNQVVENSHLPTEILLDGGIDNDVKLLVEDFTNEVSSAPADPHQQILVIQTGGSIDKDYPQSMRGYAFEIGEPAVVRIFERADLQVPVVLSTACRKDSQDLTADDKYLIYECCANAAQKRILITHGTDGLLDTAEYLSQIPALSSKFIILTGATKPETFKNSDADFNVGCAIAAAQMAQFAGVYVCMNGLAARWNEVERDQVSGKFVRKVEARTFI